MAKKDKFAQMQQSGGVGSFQQTLVQAATTVAAIERQHEVQTKGSSSSSSSASATPLSDVAPTNPQEPPRFMRLPNPQIPMQEYNLVSTYCTQFANMTRMDFVELAIIEKLHSVGSMTDEDYLKRQKEITSRPPRGQRKGTKTSKQISN